MTAQLPLPFPHAASYDPAEFIPSDSNAAALAWLDAAWPGGRLAVWGVAGSGKTHLLHLWAGRVGAAVMPGEALPSLPSLSALRGIAVDDADRAPERPLLHLLNAAAEAGLPVLLAARAAPARWATHLPDLASRLRAVTAVELATLDDDMLRTLFTRLLAARPLAVPEPVQEWLLRRLPREPAALREAASRLDAASLAARRRVTQAIAAQVVADMADEATDAIITVT